MQRSENAFATNLQEGEPPRVETPSSTPANQTTNQAEELKESEHELAEMPIQLVI